MTRKPATEKQVQYALSLQDRRAVRSFMDIYEIDTEINLARRTEEELRAMDRDTISQWIDTLTGRSRYIPEMPRITSEADRYEEFQRRDDAVPAEDRPSEEAWLRRFAKC